METTGSYERTWRHVAGEAGRQRWDILINGKEVPDGFVLRRETGVYEAHYPHFESTPVYDTLDEALSALECAPVALRSGQRIGKMASDADELIEVDEAADLLGVSRYRVNAMVANGVLAGTRADGKVLVGRSSVERKIAAATANAPEGAEQVRAEDAHKPQGRFAHRFLRYVSVDGSIDALVELDHEDEDTMSQGALFADWIEDGGGSRGQAQWLDYRTAQALLIKSRNEGAEVPNPMNLDELVGLVELAKTAEATLKGQA